MGRQFLLFLLLTALRQLLQAPLEIGIPAGIALHAEPGCFLHQQLGLPGTHMEDVVAAVIPLKRMNPLTAYCAMNILSPSEVSDNAVRA